MKRSTLLAGLAAVLALAACNASSTLPAASAGNASASAAASAGGSTAATVDINDPSRPMFGGGIGSP